MLGAIDWGTIWPIILLVVLLIALFGFNMFSKKKYKKQEDQMRSELKVGDKIVTNAGMYGEIISLTETNFGKVALIKTGEGDKVSYMSLNASVILGPDVKQPVILDANGNPVLLDENGKPIEEPKAEETTADAKAEVKEGEPLMIEHKAEKKSAKDASPKQKDAAKKTTKVNK